MLATSKDGGETTAENKANERTLLRAQEQVFASRRRREMRRDEFVTNISRNMKLTYARAENAIAKIKLKDRLYKDISDASLFSEEISSSMMKRRSSQSTSLRTCPPLKGMLHCETTLNTQAFLGKDLTRLERANAIAEACQTTGARQVVRLGGDLGPTTFAGERRGGRAQACGHRAPASHRNWIRKRWKVRLERQDVKVLSRLEQETSGTFITSTTTDYDEAHSQSIEAYKRSRPSSAIATSTIRPVRNTAQPPCLCGTETDRAH